MHIFFKKLFHLGLTSALLAAYFICMHHSHKLLIYRVCSEVWASLIDPSLLTSVPDWLYMPLAFLECIQDLNDSVIHRLVA